MARGTAGFSLGIHGTGNKDKMSLLLVFYVSTLLSCSSAKSG